MIKRSRGRQSRQTELLEKIVLAHGPDDAGPLVLKDLQVPYGLVEELPPLEKLARISDLVATHLEKAGIEAVKRHDSGEGNSADMGSKRPWSDKDTPANIVATTEALYFTNDRMISALTAHLVNHLIVREELRSVAHAARRRAAVELDDDVPALLREFLRILRIEGGLLAADVNPLSPDRIPAIMEAINGTVLSRTKQAAEPLSDAPDPARPAGSLDDKAGELNADQNEPGGKNAFTGYSGGAQTVCKSDHRQSPVDPADLQPDTPKPQFDANIAAPGAIASGNGPSPVSASVAALPSLVSVSTHGGSRLPGLWDDLDLCNLPYRIIERPASSADDMKALGFAMPECRMLKSLPLLTDDLVDRSCYAMGGGDGRIAEEVLISWMPRVKTTLSNEELRGWSFLLIEYPMRKQSRWTTPEGWYHGVILPGTVGSRTVRQLVSKDINDEVKSNAFRVVREDNPI
jgi:hypothetical protein